MLTPKVNNGIHGERNYKPKVVADLEKEVQALRAKYPVNRIEIDLADRTDPRWNNNGYAPKNSEKV